VLCDPDNTAHHVSLGAAYELAGRSDLAVREHEKALRINRKDRDALYNLGAHTLF
jgi:Flp pilus assembly protein TadD